MRKGFMALAAVLVALPVSAQRSRVTPTPAASKQPKKVISSGKGKMPAYGREAATPTSGSEAEKRNSGHATESVEAGTPTPGPAAAVKFGRDKLKGTTREAAGTPTPKRVDSINLNSSRSNSYRVRPTVTPTPAVKGRA